MTSLFVLFFKLSETRGVVVKVNSMPVRRVPDDVVANLTVPPSTIRKVLQLQSPKPQTLRSDAATMESRGRSVRSLDQG